MKQGSSAPGSFPELRRGNSRSWLRGRRGIALAIGAGLLALGGGVWWAASRRAPGSDPGTLRMAALLVERASRVDPLLADFPLNELRAAALGRKLESTSDPGQRLSLRISQAVELLNAGDIARCREGLEVFVAEAMRLLKPPALDRAMLDASFHEALAQLRVAEVENCCARTTPDSCLLPIRDKGIHERKEGSTRAVQVLEEILAGRPDHLSARWLLNIAHMTLGTYPQGVPERHLIPPRVFESEHPLPRFPNVAAEAGVDIYGLAGGAALDDFDGDGLQDLVVSAVGLADPLRFLRNRGDGRFEDRSEKAGIRGEVGGLNLIHGDHDNDGDLDVVVLRGGWMRSEGKFPLSLLRNDGDATFADVTEEAGLLRFAPTQTAVWLDHDADGWLDLFVGNESVPQHSHPCHLFRNDGRGRFTDVAPAVGADQVGYVKAAASADYDNDGRPDLFLSVLNADNVLLRNEGPVGDPSGPGRGWRFTNVAAQARVLEPRASFGCFFFDYDNDGWQDLFVVGYGFEEGYTGPIAEAVAADYLGLPHRAERGRLYRNAGNGSFLDVTREAGLYRVVLAMGLNFGDLDNDGFLDIYFGTGNPSLSTLIPNRMFRNAEGRTFQDVTTAGNFGHLQKGHAICFGDVDNDGDQDVFAQMGGVYTSDKAYSSLYENPGNGNAWVALQLRGMKSNRSAVGARVRVSVETPQGLRTFHRTVGNGASFGSSTYRLEVGLGAATQITAVEVDWPATGKTDRIQGIAPRGFYRITEGSAEAIRVERPRFALSSASRGLGTAPPR